MEMNTRLQVEHPVTEEITGLDLVEWQLRVASGEPLPMAQEELAIDGHAIEARIYAENPATGFLPSIGTLSHMRMPVEDGPVRIDSGVREGDAISPYYDPMIAKLIVWGADRAAALAAMAAALRECEIAGVATNVEFLGRVIACADFASGAVDTGLIERNRAELLPTVVDLPPAVLALAAYAQLRAEQAASAAPASPWDLRDGWRMNLTARRSLELKLGEVSHAVAIEYRREGMLISAAGVSSLAQGVVTGRKVVLSWNGARHQAQVVAAVERGGERRTVFTGGRRFDLELVDPAAQFDHEEEQGGGLTAPMSGKVLSVLVAPGAQVEKGTPLLVMEAMKMEHTISAPAKGRVAQVRYAAGEQVAEGAQLVNFEAS